MSPPLFPEDRDLGGSRQQEAPHYGCPHLGFQKKAGKTRIPAVFGARTDALPMASSPTKAADNSSPQERSGILKDFTAAGPPTPAASRRDRCIVLVVPIASAGFSGAGFGTTCRQAARQPPESTIAESGRQPWRDQAINDRRTSRSRWWGGGSPGDSMSVRFQGNGRDIRPPFSPDSADAGVRCREAQEEMEP